MQVLTQLLKQVRTLLIVSSSVLNLTPMGRDEYGPYAGLFSSTQNNESHPVLMQGF
jgi:hypothetical protein